MNVCYLFAWFVVGLSRAMIKVLCGENCWLKMVTGERDMWFACVKSRFGYIGRKFACGNECVYVSSMIVLRWIRHFQCFFNFLCYKYNCTYIINISSVT